MKIIQGILGIIVIVAISFILFTPQAKAVPFGGLILTSIPCTCSFNAWIIVGPPSPITAMYQPFVSTLYQRYNPTPGHWTLGITYPGHGVCLQYALLACVPIGGGLVIDKFGTS